MAGLITGLGRIGLTAGLAVLVAVACSSASGSGNSVGNGASTGSGGSGASASGGGAGFNTGTGGGNSGGSSGFNTGTGGGNSGGSGGLGQDACASTQYTGGQLPLDMYIMLDKSGSMQGSSWTAVTSAITDFVSASPETDGIGVGLQFFPLGGSGPTCLLAPCPPGCVPFGGFCVPDPNSTSGECAPNTYLPPAVSIQTLPAVKQQVIDAINKTSPNGGTPTLPAMQSAVQATTAFAVQHPDHKVIIVLATDGEPNDCNSTAANVAAVAAQGHSSTPAVDTWVIGIGNVANLDTIAQSGGTQKAIIVDTSAGSQAFLDAMKAITGQALGCEFLIPTPTGGGQVDPSKVNVDFNGQTIPQVSDASQCKGLDGWYYDSTKTKVELCPTSCTAVTSAPGKPTVGIQLGCQTIVAPPR